MRHLPTPLHRDVGRVGGVLASREQSGDTHASRRAMEGKRLRDPMLTLFKVNEEAIRREPFMAFSRIPPRAPREVDLREVRVDREEGSGGLRPGGRAEE